MPSVSKWQINDRVKEQSAGKCQPATPVSATLAQLVPLLRDSRLLDVGCGGGGQLRHFPKSIGADISLANLQACAKWHRPLCCADIEAPLPFASGAFDVVLLSHVLEHVSSPLLLCKESWRILAQKGLLIIGVPLESSIFRVLTRDHYFDSHPGHLYSFSPTGLCQIARSAGFDVKEVLFDVPLARRMGSEVFQRLTNRLISPNILKWFCANMWILAEKNQATP